MVLILVALALSIFGTIQLTRSLDTGQRVVAWIVFCLAIVWLFWTLVQAGVLGHATGSTN